jgi:hypothetical protein
MQDSDLKPYENVKFSSKGKYIDKYKNVYFCHFCS